MTSDHSDSGATPVLLTELPRTDETWEVAAVTLPDAGEPGISASFLIVADRESERILHMDIHLTGDFTEAVADLVAAVCGEPSEGEPRLPAMLVVDRDDLLPPLSRRFGEVGVRVQFEPRVPIAERLAMDELLSVLPKGPEGGYLDAGLPVETAGEMFDAAAEFYRAAPWKLLDDTEPLELVAPGWEGPWYAVVMGSGEVTMGLAMFREVRSIAAIVSPTGGPVGTTMSLTFGTRSEAPPELIEEADRNGWKIASKKAFPLALHTTSFDVAEGAPETRYPNGEEAADITLVLRAVTAFCTRHRRDLRRGDPAESAEAVRAADGETVIVKVRTVDVDLDIEGLPDSWPDDDDWDDETDLWDEDDTEDDDSATGDPELITEADRRFYADLRQIHEITSAWRPVKSLAARLAWSFHRDSFPHYAGPDPQDLEDAHTRFVEWTLFGAQLPPDDVTIAQRAIDESPGLSDEERSRLRKIAQARYGIYEVEDAQRTDDGARAVLRDLGSGHTFEVRGRYAAALANGRIELGPIFPTGEGWWTGGGSLYSNDEPDPESRSTAKQLADTEGDVALNLEAVIFDASDLWIADLKPGELRRAYDEFREAMGGPMSELPTLAALQKRVREAESPADVMRDVLRLDWWYPQEIQIFATFLTCVWNLTPRRDDHASQTEIFPRPTPSNKRAGTGKKKKGKNRRKR